MTNPFARLEELSTQLNISSDTVTETIKRMEAKLASLRLGVSVWLEKPLDTDVGTEGNGEIIEEYCTKFGYSKVKGKWCLAVKSPDAFEVRGELEDTDPIPLQQASREHRVLALRRMPELIKALEVAAEAELKNVRMAITIAENA